MYKSKQLIINCLRLKYWGEWVYVRAYTRVRNGRMETVAAHWREWPKHIPTVPKPSYVP